MEEQVPWDVSRGIPRHAESAWTTQSVKPIQNVGKGTLIVGELSGAIRHLPQEEKPRNGPKETEGWEPSARTVSWIQQGSHRVPLGSGVDLFELAT